MIQVNCWEKVIVRSDFCTAGWVGVESNSRWVVSLCLLKFTYPARLLYHIWGFLCKTHEYHFLAFLFTDRTPGWSWRPQPEAPVGSGCHLGGHLLCTGLWDDAQTMSERKELFYYKSISRSPLAVPGVSFVLLPHARQ